MNTSDPMYQWRLKRSKKAIKEVAQMEGRSAKEVYADMQALILEASQCTDPEARANFAKIPRVGALPTPEEFLAFGVTLWSEMEEN